MCIEERVAMEDKTQNDTVTLVVVDPKQPQVELEKRLLVGDEVGRGGSASVRRMVDTNLKRDIALKMLHKAGW